MGRDDAPMFPNQLHVEPQRNRQHMDQRTEMTIESAVIQVRLVFFFRDSSILLLYHENHTFAGTDAFWTSVVLPLKSVQALSFYLCFEGQMIEEADEVDLCEQSTLDRGAMLKNACSK